MNYDLSKADEPMRKLRNHLRERYGSHGLERFWHEIAEESVSNWELAKRWKISLWDVRCARSQFVSFSRLVFPRKKRAAVILPMQKRA